MKILILIATLFIFVPTFSQQNNNLEWKSDLEYLKSELPKKHKNLFWLKSEKEFNTGLDRISGQSKELTNFEIVVKLQQLIASMGDSHTGINFTQYIDKSKILPIHLYWFSDGLYVLHTSNGNEAILGKRITKINNCPIEVVVDSLSTLLTVDNESFVKSRATRFIPIVQLLEYFGFCDAGKVILEMKDVDGKLATHKIQAEIMNRNERISFKPNAIANFWRNEKVFFTDNYLEEDKIYTIQYNKCLGKEIALRQGRKNAEMYPSFKEFKTKVLKTIETKEIDKLIFDMRLNGGGSSAQGTEFIKKLSKIKSLNKQEKMYVVIGRSTFSSAIINTMDFKKHTDAVIVGEETGGKPNHYGEVKSFKLPSSGLVVAYSTKYFVYTNKDVNTITPDVVLLESFEHYKNGIDPVLEWVKKQ